MISSFENVHFLFHSVEICATTAVNNMYSARKKNRQRFVLFDNWLTSTRVRRLWFYYVWIMGLHHNFKEKSRNTPILYRRGSIPTPILIKHHWQIDSKIPLYCHFSSLCSAPFTSIHFDIDVFTSVDVCFTLYEPHITINFYVFHSWSQAQVKAELTYSSLCARPLLSPSN